MEVFKTAKEIQARSKWLRKETDRLIGFVPTMGALHAGHEILLQAAKKECDTVVLSIFVNPTQFGPQEDFEKYPRTLERDLEIAKNCGVDLVFTPAVDQIYPEFDSVTVEESFNSSGLCGEFRPGHFRGVTTVVLKLFNLVLPHRAYFGLKDAQQFFVLKKMVRDLHLDVQLCPVPTVREKDGLALSSRNRFLSPQEREMAPFLYHHLKIAQVRLREGMAWETVQETAKEALEKSGFRVQYFELKEFLPDHEKVIAAAAYLGKTRLIDNLLLS